MKFSKLILFSLLTLLFITSCKDDDDDDDMQMTTIVDFGDAPLTSIIPTASVEVITEDLVRYHTINFAGGNYTSNIVETEDGIVLVDLGPEIPNTGTELRAYADAINKPMSVIITHDHGDHYGNISSFTDATVYSEASSAEALMADPGFTDVYTNSVTGVSSSQTIAGVEFKFDKVANAETEVNGYAYIPSLKALFPGDLVYNRTHFYIREYTPLDGSDELDNWVDGLNELKSTFGNYDHVFMGHGGKRSDVSTVIDEGIAYLNDAQGLIKGTKELTAGGFATTNQEVVDELEVLYPNYLEGGIELSLPDAFFPGDPGANWFGESEVSNIVIEVTTFNLNAGVDANAFEDRDAEIEQDFASVQPGFIKRTSGLDANGKYVVMVFWDSLADADASIAAFGNDPSVADYFAMIDGSTFIVERFTSLSLPDTDFALAANNVIEITTFNLNAGVDANAFEARDAEIEQDFASIQPGFIERTSGVDADGKYAVIVFWQTLADADASIAAFGNDPSVADYFAMIDGNTFLAERFGIFN